jgi:hypothetical protein
MRAEQNQRLQLEVGKRGKRGGTPTVSFAATSLLEGGTGQNQRQIQNQARAFDFDLHLPLRGRALPQAAGWESAPSR